VRSFKACKVTTSAGLSRNWTVEMLPGNLIRTVRSDGAAWTFNWNPLFRRVQPLHSILEDALAQDDDAEALTVAELSVARHSS
jgi:hypothetical protein